VNRAVTLQRLECQLVLVSLAQQHPERPLTVPALAGRRGEPAAQQRQRAAALVVGELVGRRLGELAFDQLAFDPARRQPAPDPVRAPLLERALVLDEQAGEPLVVEDPVLDQPVDCGVDGVRLDLAREQVCANLGDRSVAPVEVPVGERERSLDLVRFVGYAARPSTGSTAERGASWRSSIGLTRSRPIPSTA
jgi:hypothetical protein